MNGKGIRLTIPAGVENGQVIKIAGHGGPGVNGGPNGDLYITFSIANDSKFKREGSNLYANVDVDLYTAVLGGDIMVDSFDGKVKLKVAPETQSGTKVKLKGKGFPVYKSEGKFGDLYITYHVKLPSNLTQQEKDIDDQPLPPLQSVHIPAGHAQKKSRLRGGNIFFLSGSGFQFPWLRSFDNSVNKSFSCWVRLLGNFT